MSKDVSNHRDVNTRIQGIYHNNKYPVSVALIPFFSRNCVVISMDGGIPCVPPATWDSQVKSGRLGSHLILRCLITKGCSSMKHFPAGFTFADDE